ncbi:MAG: transposase, partial [Actinobacteria bacterium]|nr:transposase [Actinomycetota bacterium]
LLAPEIGWLIVACGAAVPSAGGGMIALQIGWFGGWMLRLSGGQAESLFDEALPIEVRELPEDLAALDALLSDPAVLAPVERAWDRGARGHGRPTIPIDRFVRLMVIKQRTGWGYETLAREVSDSLHLRRFCLIALTERVPDESTIRKLCRRLGSEVIEEICRQVIAGAVRERRFVPRAARIDSTVVEADIRYPSDLGLAADATRTLAREAAKASALAGEGAPHVQDRSRATNRRLRTLNRTLARRTGQGKETALRLTGQAGDLVRRSAAETRRLADRLRERARGRGARTKLAAARQLEELADRADKVCRQIRQRLAGEKITDRLVSISDPDARPIRKGKLRQPTEFGYVVQITEITENTRRGARGLILPAPSQVGSPNESDLLPQTGAELERLGIAPREVALDGGFQPSSVDEHLPARERTFIAGRQSAGSRRTDRRLARYRVGAEGRISHLKRGYGLKRSRLKGHPGAQTWTAWAILAYDLDTLAIRTG